MPKYNVKLSLSETTVVIEADDAEEAAEQALEDQPDGSLITVAMTPESVEALYQEILGRLKETYELVFVDYDEQFSTQQIGWIVDGDDEKLWESTDEWESDSQYHGAQYVLEDVTTLGERTDLGALADEVTEAIRERDCSNWVKQMARHTSDVMVRYRISEDYVVCYGQEDEAEVEIAELLGITAPNAKLSAAIAEAGNGGGVYLYFGMSVQDLLDIPHDTALTITVENPYVLILDTMNGSGFVTEDAMELTWTGDFDRDNLFLDKQGAGHGYSWDETCGGGQTPRYYKEPTVTITKKEATHG